MFLLSGLYKIRDFQPTINGFINKTNLSQNLSTIAISGAAILQIAASAIILYESFEGKGTYRMEAMYSAYALAVFTVLATIVYYFPPYGRNYYPFISNVTTFGALLLLARAFHTSK
jgi:hypothetical protein